MAISKGTSSASIGFGFLYETVSNASSVDSVSGSESISLNSSMLSSACFKTGICASFNGLFKIGNSTEVGFASNSGLINSALRLASTGNKASSSSVSIIFFSTFLIGDLNSKLYAITKQLKPAKINKPAVPILPKMAFKKALMEMP